MKIIRWWGVVAFIVITILLTFAWYLVAPVLLKSNIESFGTQALGAKLDVSEVELHLFPLGVSIKNIQATDPEQPMSNLVEIESVKFAIDTSKLLWKKIAIDELKIDGIQLATPRKSSGAIDTAKSTGNDQQDHSNDSLKDGFLESSLSFNKNDVKQMVANADLLTLKNLEKLNNNQKEIKEFWDKELKSTQHKENLKAIEKEFNRLSKRAKENSINLITDRKAWKKLKKDIKKEKESISALNKKLKSDKKEIAQQITAVKSSPEIDLNNIMSKTGLNNGLSGVSRKMVDHLVGPQFTPWIEKLVTFVNHTKNIGTTQTEKDTPIQQTSIGKKVQFKDEHLFPQLLINKVSLSGKDELWKSKGSGNNLAYLPWVLATPADLSINIDSLDGKSSANAEIMSHWQSPQNMNTQLQSTIKDWNVKSIKLMENAQGSWVVNSGVLNGSFAGSLTLDNINLDLNLAITRANISSPEGLSGWQKSLSNSLSQQNKISISISAKGNLDNPKISFNTNLEEVFSTALGENLKENIGKQKEEIEEQLSKRVGDLSNLDNLTDDFNTWTEQLKNKDNLLKKLDLGL
ncbi:MAG: TIGR03545 family protein [Kangiellaceae bacterium]